MGHMIANSLVHGAVYGMIYSVFRHLGIGMSLMLGMGILLLVWLFTRR